MVRLIPAAILAAWTFRMSKNEETAKPGTTPPYIAFQSLKTLFASLKENGLPGRIDRSVLTNFSGAVGGQIITALRFLDLIDSDGRPKPDFQLYLNGFGTDVWAQELGELLKEAYAPLFQLDLQTASPSQFIQTFKAAYPSKDETLRKCMTFFLNAAREADVRISPYIMKNKKPRAPNGAPSRRPRKAKAALDPSAEEQVRNEKPGKEYVPKQDEQNGDDFRKELLGKFPQFDPSWPDQIKEKWFAGFDQFMSMTKK